MADQGNHLRQLNAELEELRHSLVKLRRQITSPSGTTPRTDALDAVHRHANALRTQARLLQNDVDDLRASLELAEREAWDQKVRRADATAKLKGRELLLEQIQRSAAWRVVKPIWKLFNSSRRRSSDNTFSSNLAFALDLPRRWKTNREILLIKGWCFSRSGKQLAGVRAKIGRKAQLARYGLLRPDVAGSFGEYPEARHCGFTIEVKVPLLSSTVQLEAIEHGSDWQPFFRHELQRELGNGTDEGDDPNAGGETKVDRNP